jgi:hypothetical protein
MRPRQIVRTCVFERRKQGMCAGVAITIFFSRLSERRRGGAACARVCKAGKDARVRGRGRCGGGLPAYQPTCLARGGNGGVSIANWMGWDGKVSCRGDGGGDVMVD